MRSETRSGKMCFKVPDFERNFLYDSIVLESFSVAILVQIRF